MFKLVIKRYAQIIANILPFNVIHEINNGIIMYIYKILVLSLNFSMQYKIQGNKANARISGLNTNLRTIETGKKFRKTKVIKIVEFLNLYNFKR